MKIQYIGRSENRDYREAYISYAAEKEQAKFDKLYVILSNKGWTIECEDECATVQVHNKEEYLEFLHDYKEAKRSNDLRTV